MEDGEFGLWEWSPLWTVQLAGTPVLPSFRCQGMSSERAMSFLKDLRCDGGQINLRNKRQDTQTPASPTTGLWGREAGDVLVSAKLLLPFQCKHPIQVQVGPRAGWIQHPHPQHHFGEGPLVTSLGAESARAVSRPERRRKRWERSRERKTSVKPTNTSSSLKCLCNLSVAAPYSF